MNKIFKIIWNKTTQRLEVVSELAKSQGKAKASTDKRESLNDSSLKGFKLTQGLKPLSLLVAFAIAMPSYAAVTNFSDSQNNGLNIWGSNNSRQGNVGTDQVNAAVIAGAGNTLGDDLSGKAFYPYDNRQDDNSQKAPDAINIYGRSNKVNVGNKVNVFGTNNKVVHNSIGNSGTNLAINAMGNNIHVQNPRRSSYFGNDIYANSAHLGIGNNLSIAAGGQAVGTNITVSGDSMAIGSTITSTRSNNFLVGDSLTATNQNQFIAGQNISSGLLGASLLGRNITVNNGWANNLLAVGNSLTVNVPNTNSATDAVIMGVNSTITGGVKAVTIGSNVTSESASNSVTIGSDISTNKPNTVTIGSGNTKTEQNYSIAIGNNASTLNNSNDNGIAIGRNSVVRGDSGIALGLSAESYNPVDVAIGRNSKTDANTNSDLSAWTVSGEDVLAKYKKNGTIQTTGANNGGVVSFGSSTVKRQLKNVAAGDVSATSTDAINGAQLYALAEVVKPGTLTINAGTTKVADWKANSDKTIGFESTNSNLAVSADATNGKVKFTLADNLSVTSVTASGVEIGKNNVAVNANNKKITGLADATLSATSTDAVTGKQLNATNTNVTNVQNIANAAKQTADTAAAAVNNSYLHVKSTKTGNLAALNANGGATGNNSVALGPNVTASGASAIAIGDEASTTAAGTVSIGQNAINSATNSTVIGRNAQVTSVATDSVAIGLESIVTSTSATAIGKNANASGASSISIGQNTLTQNSATVALGYNVSATANNATAIGSYGNASGKNSITIGAASASIDNAVAIGNGANTTGSSGTAVGTGASASGGSSAAFGQRANASNTASLALGYQANASGCWTTAVGPDSVASGNFTVAMGNGANATKTYAVAIGKSAKAIHENSVALGSESETQDEADIDSVADLMIDGKEVAKKGVKKTNGKGSISVGKNGLNRQIFNVGAGRITADSTDAINGSQLFHVANATKAAIQGIKDTTFTFNIANGVTDATLKTGSQAWSIGAQNSITFGATSDLSVTRKDRFIVYGLSDEIKKKIDLAKDTADQAKATADAAKTAAEAAKTTAGEAKTIAQEAKNNSPYEIWKAKPENTSKTKDDFLASLKGAKGDKGDTGLSAKAQWLADNPTKTEADYATAIKGEKGDKGDTGLSAKAQWLADNPTKTEADYATAIKGEKGDKGDTGAAGAKGDTGLSAKAQWLADNPGKTDADYATATKGEKGDKGDTGPVGPRGPKGDAGTGGSEAKVAKVTTGNSGNLSVKSKANGDTEITLGKDLQGLNSISIGSGPSAVSITENGLNNGGHRITNVAAGVKPTDAANVAQVNAVENRLNNKIGKLDKKLRGGIANAVAVANIPQVTIPGANMVAVGTGNYKGQSALAVGYSRASDNNRVIIKMSASATTQGDYSVGGGIGYQW